MPCGISLVSESGDKRVCGFCWISEKIHFIKGFVCNVVLQKMVEYELKTYCQV